MLYGLLGGRLHERGGPAVLGLDDLRGFATALPEVEETTHFRLPTFKVRGRPFAGLEKSATHAIVAVDQAEAGALAAEDPAAYQGVWRGANGRIFVGLRVDLARVPPAQLQELVEHAWRRQAPGRLLAADDERG
jgi:hypothetical protein